MKKVNLSIAGLGNVGSALVYSIENYKSSSLKTNLNLNILGISAKDQNKERIFDVKKYKWFDNPKDLIKVENEKPDILVELIGNEKGISYELVRTALLNKINVITGNKAMLANHGKELFEIAEKNSVMLLFEAAVAGGIPIIKTIKNNLFSNKFSKISGILNGTTNFILTTMENENKDFDDVLADAKLKGFTSDHEAELDIGGYDAAHKLTLLSTLAFGSEIDFNSNEIQGIENIKIDDINFAKKLGYRIKLISESSLIDNKLYASTKPKLISINKPMANVNDALNAINIQTDKLDNLYLEGQGAGGIPTASSVMSDIFECFNSSKKQSLAFGVNELKKFDQFDTSQLDSKYYIRIKVRDKPGVLSKITSYFNESNISIEKILQLPDESEDFIPIIITTHVVKSLEIIEAVKKIEQFEFVQEKISLIPIES
tara:strand:+ start:2761 stop:4053 length:1293 start_codon:yes stop_codon:yes gene_type:complete